MGNSQLAIFLGSGKVEPFQSSWLWITCLSGFPSASGSSKKWRRGWKKWDYMMISWDMNGYQWILYTWINSRCFIIQLKRNVASSRLIRVIILQTVKNRSRGNSWFQDIHSSTQTAPISDGFGNVLHLFLMVLAMFCTYFWWFCTYFWWFCTYPKSPLISI